MRQLLLILSLLCASCSAEPESSPSSDARARQLYGLAAPYSPNRSLWNQLEALNASQMQRRTAAWQTIEKVFAPTTVASNSIPAWLTWYPAGELVQINRRLQQIEATSEDTPNENVEAAFAAHVAFLWRLPGWTADRFARWQANFPDTASVAGAGGLARTMYNTQAARHILLRSGDLAACAINRNECKVTPFPVGSVIVKASWKRLNEDDQVAVFETTPNALASQLAAGEWLSKRAEPVAPQRGLSVKLGDVRYMMTGLHIMAKETQDWVWATVWFSLDDSQEFRDDASQISFLGGQYRMCTVTGFEDERSSNDAKQETQEALHVAHDYHDDRYSWCSNPFLEKGFGNSRTNCIGCHQYAGTGAITKDILQLSTNGVAKMRSDFPSDYVFGIGGPPDNLALKLSQ